MATSSTRHRVWLSEEETRKSSADANALAEKPNSRSRSGSDSRTDSSSSTTDTRWRASLTMSSRGTRHGGRLTRGVCVLVRHDLTAVRDREGERGTWTVVGHRHESAAVTFDDGSADGEADPHAAALGGVERVEQLRDVLR